MRPANPTTRIIEPAQVAGRAAVRPLKILFVAPSLDILGGQAVQANRLLKRWRESPDVHIGFQPINPRLPGALRVLQSVKYLRTVVTSLVYVVQLFLTVPRYDILHVFSASYLSFVLAPTPAILIGKLFRKKVLLNYHSGEAEDHLTRWPSAVSTIRLTHDVVVPSAYLVSVFERFGIRSTAINNIVELDDFVYQPRLPLQPIFLSNRNFELHYGVDHLLRAFALIQAQVPDAQLIVAGDGPERRSLLALAENLNLKNVNFRGRVKQEEIVEEYRSSHIYLNASEIDNQPLSILEAFACGLPVVSTNAGGIPDMVRNGETGCLVERGDCHAIADHALWLLQNPDCAAVMCEAARKECQKYSWDAVHFRWLDVYRNLSVNSIGARANRFVRLRQMGVNEAWVRTSQAVAAFAERHGLSSLARLPSDNALPRIFEAQTLAHTRGSRMGLLDHFRLRETPVFFASFSDFAAGIDQFQSRWPAAKDQILREADRICDNRFDLLGLKDLSFGDPIDWQREPITAKNVPLVHWSRLDYLNPAVAGDKKIIWELNRHQYFLTLGQAYSFTGDEKYARAFVIHLNSWMDRNPPKLGINWSSSLEIALRSISWLWAIYFFKDSPTLDESTFTRALKFLFLNARHLETYLSTYFSPNTHLTGEALGLFYLGTLLPEFRQAKRWREIGKEILLEQLDKQIRSDGVYFEQSSYYHRYTVDFYTHFLLLSRANNQRLDSKVENKLSQLLDHLMFITRPDGTSPLFGDEDGGRLLFLDRRNPNDFRAALSTGAVLFGRADYKFVAGELAEETFWLFGTESIRTFEEIKAEEPSRQSTAFAESGYYILRDGWKHNSNYLLFDCGPHGANNCGHSHADALAIEVTAKGVPVLVDTGTYTYTGSKELRDSFRSSAAHNVLLLDGESSSAPAGPFTWATIAECKLIRSINAQRFDYVSGAHDGYNRLPNPATHRRSILFLKNDYWVLRDRVVATGPHYVDLRFHFDSGVAVECGDDAQVSCTVNNVGLQVFTFSRNGRWRREDGWISPSYRKKASAVTCSFKADFSSSDELITLLLPRDSTNAKAFSVKELEAIGGRAFEITNDKHRDVILLRDETHGQRVETATLVSDGTWTWARFAIGSDILDELLLLDGSRIELNGQRILKSTNQINYLVANRIANKFRVETAERVFEIAFPLNDLDLIYTEQECSSSGVLTPR